MKEECNVYLLYGEEKYDLNKFIEDIKKKFERLEVGVNLFNLNLENIDELETILDTVTFFGSSKLIIIQNTKLKFDIDIVLANINTDNTILIVEDTVDKRTSEFKKLKSKVTCLEFKKMDAKQIVNYTTNILKKYNITIDYETACYFQSICSDDKNGIINELLKLVNYLHAPCTVTKNDIEAVCSKTLNAKIFDLLDLIIEKRHKESIELLDSLLKQKESIIKIYIMLYKKIKQIYMIKVLKLRNENNIADTLKIPPFVYKTLNKVVDNYSLEKLEEILLKFGDYDENIKLGNIDSEIGLKKLICMM